MGLDGMGLSVPRDHGTVFGFRTHGMGWDGTSTDGMEMGLENPVPWQS